MFAASPPTTMSNDTGVTTVSNDTEVTTAVPIITKVTVKLNDTKVEEEQRAERLLAAARSDDFEAVKKLVEEEGVPASASNYQHETAAHIAVKNGNADILKFIVDKDPSVLSVKTRQNETVLRLIIERKAMEMLKYLEEKYVTRKLSRRNFQSAAVHAAAHFGHLDIMKLFLEEKKCDVDIRDEFEETPAFTAVEERQLHIFEYLFDERNANLTLLDRYGSNILYEFIRIDQLPLMRYVLDEKKVPLDVNSRNVFNDTILHKAALWNRLNIVEYLIEEKGATVNPINDNNMTPLHIAAWKERENICKYLVEHGADLQIRDFEGKTPSGRCGNKELAEYLNTTTTRTRRSVNDRLGQLWPSQPFAKSEGRSWQRGNDIDFFPPTGLLGDSVQNSSPANAYSTHNQFNNLLFMLESIVTNASRQAGGRPSFASQTGELMRKRIDPVAVDVVNDIYDFSKNDKYR